MRLCFNAIVKNEAVRIERCLASVIPYISCWSITDTGSYDGTPGLIESLLAGIPGELRRKPFTNFADSRNDALDGALQQDCDYILLCDADMEFVAEPEWDRDLSHDAYLLLQKAGDVSYRNVRLLKKGVRARYVGATHEYLSVEGQVWALDEAWFIDHADGNNRPGKFERDRLLLEQQYRRSLPTDTRTVYYLAQTCRDLGDLARAAELYQQRAGMSDDEEAWRALVERARCLKAGNNDSEFVLTALSAFGRRPHRAEPLYDLARFLVDEKRFIPALMFLNTALHLPWPARELGVVDEHIYKYGLRELYAVAAFTDPAHVQNGKLICDSLALDKTVPDTTRWGARNNYGWYVDTIDKLMPSWQARRMRAWMTPTGYNPMNPSITRVGDELFGIVRTVSYWIEEDGYRKTGWESPIHSRNFLMKVDPETLVDNPVKELLPPVDLPAPRNTVVTGLEDMRLFHWRGDLWCSATMVEQSDKGLAEIVLGRINGSDALDSFRRMPSPHGQHEKNWMPIVSGDKLRFLYKCGPDTIVVDEYGDLVQSRPTTVAVDHFKGSSQLVPFNGDGWLAVIHYSPIRNKHPRVYHRFVEFNDDFKLTGVSPGFEFPCPRNDFRTGYQYVCGLCRHPDEERFVISFCLDEQEAWLGTASIDDVGRSIRPVG